MKKLNILLLAMIVGSISFMTACQEDDDDPIVDLEPTINLVAGADYVSQNTTLDAGEEFTVRINAFSNSNSDAELTNFKVTRVFENNPQVVLDSAINVETFQIEIVTNARMEEGTENWIFEIRDEDGETAEENLVITTEGAAGPIMEYSQTTLGSYDSNIGSSFASLNGNVYALSEAVNNSAEVDIMYYWDAEPSENSTIVAPANPVAADVFSHANWGVQTWSVRNNTQMKLVTESVDWDAIDTDARIVELATDFTDNIIHDLDVGDVLAFETDADKPSFASKKGLIMITDINDGSAGSITFDVKVQE